MLFVLPRGRHLQGKGLEVTCAMGSSGCEGEVGQCPYSASLKAFGVFRGVVVIILLIGS